MFILSQWSQPCGRTIASMYAIPFTDLRWRLAQSKPRAEPQSWTTKVTRSRTSKASSRASRWRRCSTNRYEPGPLLGSLSESPMPIRSGAMQRPRDCRCGNTLRQRYDEVGLPCNSTMGSPSPISTYAISRPRTRRRCFWYGNAVEIMFVSPHTGRVLFAVHPVKTSDCGKVRRAASKIILKPHFLRHAVQYHSRQGSLSSPRRFQRRVSRLRNDLYRGIGSLRRASLFETPWLRQEGRTDRSCPRPPAMAASIYENIPEISDRGSHSMRNRETNPVEYLCSPAALTKPHPVCMTRAERFLDR